jgi:protein-disulfide isomerase
MLFENQNDLGLPLYDQIAKQFGFNEQELVQALENRTDEPRVLDDFNGGVRSGVNGTPTLFINGVRYNQGVEYDSLKMTLDNILLQGKH